MLDGAHHRWLFAARVWRRRLLGHVRGGWYRLVRRPLGYLAWTLWCRVERVPDSMLSRRNALARLGDLTLLSAPPAIIEAFVRDEDVKRRNFVWCGDWDQRVEPLEQHSRYRLMADIWAHRDHLEDSARFRELIGSLEAGKPVEVLNFNLLLDSPERVLAFLQQQLNLFHSLARDGFQPGLAPDELKVAIGRNGEILKANGGRKRLMASRILGLPAIPLRIAYMHDEWLRRHRQPGAHRGTAARAALRAVQAQVAAATGGGDQCAGY